MPSDAANAYVLPPISAPTIRIDNESKTQKTQRDRLFNSALRAVMHSRKYPHLFGTKMLMQEFHHVLPPGDVPMFRGHSQKPRALRKKHFLHLENTTYNKSFRLNTNRIATTMILAPLPACRKRNSTITRHQSKASPTESDTHVANQTLLSNVNKASRSCNISLRTASATSIHSISS